MTTFFLEETRDNNSSFNTSSSGEMNDKIPSPLGAALKWIRSPRAQLKRCYSCALSSAIYNKIMTTKGVGRRR